MSGVVRCQKLLEAVFQTVTTTSVTLQLSLVFALQFLGPEIYNCYWTLSLEVPEWFLLGPGSPPTALQGLRWKSTHQVTWTEKHLRWLHLKTSFSRLFSLLLLDWIYFGQTTTDLNCTEQHAYDNFQSHYKVNLTCLGTQEGIKSLCITPVKSLGWINLT